VFVTHKIGIVGASGYGGAELVRLVGAHPALELAVVAAHSHAGQPIGDLFPNLALDQRLAPTDPGELSGLDLVFLATPHDTALELAAELSDTRIVDLSAAYRLGASDFTTWYGHPHPDPAATPATYGLTEWNRSAIAGSRLVANPGCYPTAALLGLLPVADLLEPRSIVVDAKSGTSGAGRGLRDDLHHPHAHDDVAAYGAPHHRHTVEIETWLAGLSDAAGTPISFTPHLVPMARGLLATCYATLRDGIGATDVMAALEHAYADEPFVRVLPDGRFPHTKALNGSNGCQVAAVVDQRAGRVVVMSAIDNLGKGAAGQALQNANLLLGEDETAGLSSIGVYP
jgi:N-acetyl-gamma-glutamyl-phosphate reductase